jgi:hypothetical protein
MAAKRKSLKHEPEVRTVAKAKKVGRPTDYREEFAEQARILSEQGATFYDLAEAFNVTTVTIWRWRNTVPEFCNAIKTVRAEADDRVVNALYERAVGYSYKTKKVFQFQGAIVEAPVIEHVPPDVTAAIFWLKNRDPARWRDVKALDVNVNERRQKHIDAINAMEAEAQRRRALEIGE